MARVWRRGVRWSFTRCGQGVNLQIAMRSNSFGDIGASFLLSSPVSFSTR
jgi:hypothetical protein